MHPSHRTLAVRHALASLVEAARTQADGGWCAIGDLFPDVRGDMARRLIGPFRARGIVQDRGNGPAKRYALAEDIPAESVLSLTGEDIRRILEPHLFEGATRSAEHEDDLVSDDPEQLAAFVEATETSEEEEPDVAMLLADRLTRMTDALVSMNDRLETLSKLSLASSPSNLVTREVLEETLRARDESLATAISETIKRRDDAIHTAITEALTAMAKDVAGELDKQNDQISEQTEAVVTGLKTRDEALREHLGFLRDVSNKNTRSIEQALETLDRSVLGGLQSMTKDVASLLKTLNMTVANLTSEERTSRQLLKGQLKTEPAPSSVTSLPAVFAIEGRRKG